MILWVVTVRDDTGVSRCLFECQDEAMEYARHMNGLTPATEAEVGRYFSEDYTDVEYTALKEQYDTLSVEADGLRTALAEAKEESEKRIDKVAEELRVARSDVHTLEEVIVKMAMRLVGM